MATFCVTNNSDSSNLFWDMDPLSLFIDWPSYLLDYLMDEHHSWYNESVWHRDWPHQVYVFEWHIFYGLVILLHILRTIWWRNIVFGVMDQCDTKIDLVKYMWVMNYISWSIDFALYLVIDLNLFLYFIRNDTGRGYSCPSGVLL